MAMKAQSREESRQNGIQFKASWENEVTALRAPVPFVPHTFLAYNLELDKAKFILTSRLSYFLVSWNAPWRVVLHASAASPEQWAGTVKQVPWLWDSYSGKTQAK